MTLSRSKKNYFFGFADSFFSFGFFGVENCAVS